MGQAMGELLPLAFGVALSPVPIIAVILILGTARARANGVAFEVPESGSSASPATLIGNGLAGLSD